MNASLYSEYKVSERKPVTLLIGPPSNSFLHRSSTLWNTLAPKLKVFDYSIKINHIRNLLKKALLIRQHIEPTIEWTSEDHNVSKTKVYFGNHNQS